MFTGCHRPIVLFLTIIVLSISAVPGKAFSQETGAPLWELGLFNAAARIPHYRGSDEYNWYAFPLPYFIYRGRIIRSQRDGVRGIFYENDHVEFNVSLFGNPPVSSDNQAREGMPELDAIFEVGPVLRIFLADRHLPDKLYLDFSARMASSIGFDDGLDFAYRGLRMGGYLVYRNFSLLAAHRMFFGLSVGCDFSDSRLNGYFYDVDPEYVRSDRQVYDAGSGYSGLSTSAVVSKKLTDTLSIGGYIRWDNIDGAVFENSPLVREKNNVVAGCALTWKIMEARKKVPTSAEDRE